MSDGPLTQELCGALEQDNATLRREKEDVEQRIQQVKNKRELIQENLQQRNPLDDLIQSLQVGGRRNRLGLGKAAAGGRAAPLSSLLCGDWDAAGGSRSSTRGLCWETSSCCGGGRTGRSGKPGAVAGLQGVGKKSGVVGAESECLGEGAA